MVAVAGVSISGLRSGGHFRGEVFHEVTGVSLSGESCRVQMLGDGRILGVFLRAARRGHGSVVCRSAAAWTCERLPSRVERFGSPLPDELCIRLMAYECSMAAPGVQRTPDSRFSCNAGVSGPAPLTPLVRQ